ncbi:hypothetical protein BSKO_00996 [Bryopsis sp. KO-2023]|nr:hypothetical protein BSKO_00996 [Bryopsis sp. KO-2023]
MNLLRIFLPLEAFNSWLEQLRGRLLTFLFWAWIQLRKHLQWLVNGDPDVVNLKSRKGLKKRSGNPPLDGGPLSFFDDFRVVDGVPVFVFDPNNLPQIEGEDLRITCCNLSRDGSRVVSGHGGGTVVVWDSNHGKVLQVLEGRLDSACAAVQFCDDRNDVIVGCDFVGRYFVAWLDGEGREVFTDCTGVWEGRSDKKMYGGVVHWPAFSRDGRYLVYPVKVSVEEEGSRFWNHCYVYIFSVRARMDPADWGKRFVLKGAEAHLDIPLLSSTREYDIAAPSFTDDGLGFMISCNGSPHGFVAAWPSFRDLPHQSCHLDGLVGRWGPKRLAVTWNVPLRPHAKESLKGACILWDLGGDVEEFCVPFSPTHPTYRPKNRNIIKDPDGHPIAWCDFVRSYDSGCKIVTASMGEEVRVILWDTKDVAPMYLLSTGISADDVILTRTEAWEAKWVERKPSPGLDLFSVSFTGAWMAFYSGQAKKGILWDTHTGVPILKFSDLSELGLSGDRKKEMDVGFSSSGNKVTMQSDSEILVWNPRVLDSQGPRGVNVVPLESEDTSLGTGEVICQFSADGDTIGVLRPFSTLLSFWDLSRGLRYIITKPDTCLFLEGMASPTANNSRLTLRDFEKEIHSANRICHFAFSHNGGKVVTCMADMSVHVWEKSDDAQEECIKRSVTLSNQLRSKYYPAWAVCFSHDTNGLECIVACEDSGWLVWMDPENKRPPVRRNANALRRCIFTSDGERACCMPDQQRVFIWDLVKKELISKSSFGIWLGGGGPEFPIRFPVNVPVSGDFTFIGMNEMGGSEELVVCPVGKHDRDLHVTSVPRNVALSEDGKWALIDSLVPCITPQKHLQRTKATHFAQEKYPSVVESDNRIWRTMDPVEMESDSLELLSLDGLVSSKRLLAPGMMPHKFCAISRDGRRVACMGKGSTIMVFNVYATEGCIPDQQTLLVHDLEHNKEVITEMLDTHGPSILNYPDYGGRTILLHALKRKNSELLTWMLGWAKANGLSVAVNASVRYREKIEENILTLALDYRSQECSQVVLKYILEGISCQMSTAEVFKDSLVKLAKVYPRLCYQALTHKSMLQELGQIQVPEHVFGSSDFKVLSDDRLMPNGRELENLWQEHAHRPDYEAFRLVPMEKRSHKLISARPYVIPYPDVAQMGSQGILQPLLLHNAPHNIYGFRPLQCVITLKWKMYAEKLLMEELVHYSILLVMYTTYSYLMGFTMDNAGIVKVLRGETDSFPVAAAVVLLANSLITWGNLIREIKQICSLYRDAGRRGLLYWAISPWNWLEMVSYILLSIIIPIVHYVPFNSKFLTSLVAAESILVWSKMLYFAQAFKDTGPNVIMIKEIIKDIVFFLVMAFSVLFGFGVAFFVLYREKRFEDCEVDFPKDSDEFNDCEDGKEKLSTTFNGPGRSLLTMFAWMLGELQIESLFLVQGSIRAVAVTLFIVYVMALMIVLLNLLIAIMGDSYDRVKNTEEIKFLKERAEVILDLETMLSDKRKAEIQKKVKRFVHVLFPTNKQPRTFKEPAWQGRVKDIQNSIKRETRASVKQVLDKLEEMEQKQADMEHHIQALMDLNMFTHPPPPAEPNPGPSADADRFGPWRELSLAHLPRLRTVSQGLDVAPVAGSVRSPRSPSYLDEAYLDVSGTDDGEGNF